MVASAAPAMTEEQADAILFDATQDTREAFELHGICYWHG